jgi:ComF family protein
MRLPAVIHRVLDFCYPGQCASCGAGYDAAAMFCSTCEAEMQSLVEAPACELCAMPLTEHGAPCPHCQGKGHSPFERIIALGLFRDPLKNAIHHAKYSRRWPLAEQLAERLMEQHRAQTLLFETQVLVPLPLHRRRQVERGYNQAELIARWLGKRCKIKVATPGVRVRDTESQTNMTSRAKRAENMRDAFALVRPGDVEGKHVVLIDDVMTTGSTLVSFARTMRIAKPASLSVLVLAIADPKGREFEVI